MRLDGSHLLPDIFFEIVKGIKVRGRVGLRSHLFDEAFFQIIFANFQEAAIGVIDDDEFLRIEQVMRDDQRADRIVGGNASGVADHVRVAGTKPEAMFEQDAGVHAGQHGDVTSRADLQVAQVKTARKDFVGG